MQLQQAFVSLSFRQIYDAGVNNEHLTDVRKAALESTKAAVRRLSIKCAHQSSSVRASRTSQKSKKGKKKKEGRVESEMRYTIFEQKR